MALCVAALACAAGASAGAAGASAGAEGVSAGAAGASAGAEGVSAGAAGTAAAGGVTGLSSAGATGGAGRDVALVLREAVAEYRAAVPTHDAAGAQRVRGLVAAARTRAGGDAARPLARLERALGATRDRLQPWPFVAQVERLGARGGGDVPGAGRAARTTGRIATGTAPTLADVEQTLGASTGPGAGARFDVALAWAQYASGPRPRLIAQDPALDARIAAGFWAGPRARAHLHDDLETAEQSLGEVTVDHAQIVTDAAILVFREGLEAVLILAAITASFVGAKRALRQPVLLGALAGLGASVLTWVLAQTIIRSLGSGGLRLQAVTGLLAIGVLLLVTNWFFHRVYWSQWIARFNRRRKLLEKFDRGGFVSGQTVGFLLLGLTSVYREGFETVLFLQSLQVSAGTSATLLGTAIGLGATLLVGGVTFALQRKLPYRRMLVVTGVLIAVVLAVMVGTTAHTMQGLGWLPTTATPFALPRWCTTWLGMHATWETLAAQAFALVFVIGSYVVARELQVHRPRRQRARAAGSAASPALADERG